VSPLPNDPPAVRCAISRRASEVSDTAFCGAARPDRVAIVASTAGNAGRTASAAKSRPSTSLVNARCGHPSTRRLHCISAAGEPVRMRICTGAPQAKR
jgi:hypothetical protein